VASARSYGRRSSEEDWVAVCASQSWGLGCRRIRLAAAGHDIWFIVRGEHLEAIHRNGRQVDSKLGDFRIFPVRPD
jgi:2-dehydropantoate 2-reductase